MGTRNASLLAWLLTGLTLLLMWGGFILTLLSRSVPPTPDFSWDDRILWLCGYGSAAVVGGLIAIRQPGQLNGWFWLLFGFGSGGIQTFAEGYTIYSQVVAPGVLPSIPLMAPLSGYGWLLGLSVLPFALLLFPTGHLLSRRWRIVAWLAAGGSLLAMISAWAIPGDSALIPVANPFALEGVAGEVMVALLDIGILTVFLAIILAIISLVIRFHRAGGVERQQMKWFAFAAVIWIAAMIQQLFPGAELPGIWDTIEEVLTFSLLPIAIGIAILRYRLYDIDVIIRRTLVYTILTIILTGVYFATVVALQSALTTASGEPSAVSIVVSTLTIAALFTPMRIRVQDSVDRRFYRRKYDAGQAPAAFAATARSEVELERLTAELAHLIQDTMQPEHLSVWLRPAPRE